MRRSMYQQKMFSLKAFSKNNKRAMDGGSL